MNKDRTNYKSSCEWLIRIINQKITPRKIYHVIRGSQVILYAHENDRPDIMLHANNGYKMAYLWLIDNREIIVNTQQTRLVCFHKWISEPRNKGADRVFCEKCGENKFE